jgi:LysM repeat protein
MKAMTPYRLIALIILVAAIIVLPTGSAFAADDEVEGPVVYRVQTDDNLRRIAARYGSSVEDLMRWNNMRSIDDIVDGQRLVVRQPSGIVESEHNGGVHIVQPSETLSGIAERYALTAGVIKQLNG